MLEEVNDWKTPPPSEPVMNPGIETDILVAAIDARRAEVSIVLALLFVVPKSIGEQLPESSGGVNTPVSRIVTEPGLSTRVCVDPPTRHVP